MRFVPALPGIARDCRGRVGPCCHVLFVTLSGCLLGGCLPNTVICCVRVSNHVPCRRVALLAPRTAGRGAGADVVWFCRLQRRHVDAPLAKPLLQARSHRNRIQPARRRRLRSNAANCRICPAASPVPVLSPAAADIRAESDPTPATAYPEEGAGSPLILRRPLRSKPPAAPRPARSRRSVAPARGRHDHHRRHQRHPRNPVASLQCFGRRHPAGQRLQRPARAVAWPATDHSAPDRSASPPPHWLRRHSPHRRANPSPWPARRRPCMSSTTATPCSVLPIATTCRSPNWRLAPTISTHRRNSASA